MTEYAGSISQLQKMAARCRDAARDTPSLHEQASLLALAASCDERAAAKEIASKASGGGERNGGDPVSRLANRHGHDRHHPERHRRSRETSIRGRDPALV